MRRSTLYSFLISALMAGPFATKAQTSSASDYYRQARQLAFEEQKFQAARALCVQAIQQDTSFTDARILMARLFAWEKQYDSARAILHSVLNNHPHHNDALSALADLAYWDKQYQEALAYCQTALQQDPGSTEWLQRKATITEAMQQTAPSHRMGISYDHFYFDKQFPQPWHIAGVEYSRVTNAGIFTGRVNYGSRYGLQAWQGEAEGYPRLSKKIYSYVNIGFSGAGNNVFPQWRSGLSLFAAMPRSWELEGGIRYLQFNDAIWIYTGSVGKYSGKYWFNLRSFIAPANDQITQSYFLTTRYYYGDTEDYLTLVLGSGVSPDENRNVQFNNATKLGSYRLSTGIHHSFGKTILFTNIAWSKDEYRPKTYGNQINIGLGLQRRF